MRYDVLLHVGIRGIGNGSTCPGIILTIHEDQLLLGSLQIDQDFHLQIERLGFYALLHFILKKLLVRV